MFLAGFYGANINKIYYSHAVSVIKTCGDACFFNPERLSYHMPVMCRFRACRLPFLSETRRDARAKGTLPDGDSCG